jgi:hypothetical protein
MLPSLVLWTVGPPDVPLGTPFTPFSTPFMSAIYKTKIINKCTAYTSNNSYINLDFQCQFVICRGLYCVQNYADANFVSFSLDLNV